VTVGKWVW